MISSTTQKTTQSTLPNRNRSVGKNHAVKIEKLGMVYRIARQPFEVIQGLDLEIGCGESLILEGPSGCGKSTLLSIIGCILTPTSGRVEIFGRDVAKIDGHEKTLFRQSEVGFIFQKFNLIRGLTALENVCIPLALQKVERNEAIRRATDILCQVGLQNHLSHTPKLMSGGQCQRVAIARALVTNPRLILADEPTASLDSKTGETIMSLLVELVKLRNSTLVTVTHDHRIFNYADRILTMENGSIIDRC